MRHVLAIVALAFGLSLGHGLARADLSPPPKDKPENANIVAGRQAIEAKDFKAAVVHLTKAVQEEPKNSDAHNLLGFSYRKVGGFDKSLEHYRTALKLDS